MRFLRVFKGMMLLGALATMKAPLWAQPPEPPPTAKISGRVTRSSDRKTVAGAALSIYWKEQQMGQARADAEGRFTLPNLLLPAPNSGSFVLLTQAPGSAPSVMMIAPDTAGEISVRLRPATTLRVKVTTLAGEALAEAEVSVPKIWIPNAPSYPPREQFRWNATPAAITDAQGAVTLSDLPALVDTQLTVRKKGFADTIVVVGPARLTQTTARETIVALAQENIIEGRLLLGEGDDRPLGIAAWSLKMQGWKFPWAEYEQWRMGHPDKQGRFVIRNVTSVEVMKEPTYGINLDLADNFKPQPGITASYVPPQRGYNVLVVLDNAGQTERWISYVEGQQQGMKLGEGETVRHDMRLQPMALLQGTFKAAAGAAMPKISYHDPRSIYSDWQTTPDEQGHFEIALPIGDVDLKVGARTVSIKGLKAHEVRAIDVSEAAVKPE